MRKANPIANLLTAVRSRFSAIAVTAVLLSGIGVIVFNVVAPYVGLSPAAPVVAAPVAATPGATLRIDREEAELGTMSVDEVRSAEFKLANVGNAPVEIAQVGTSCMCTFAQIEIGGEKSPEFNMEMHNSPEANSWRGVVQPGETAIVTLNYQPSLMPVEGSVARNVKFRTNDPENPTVELGVHATVQGGASG